MIYPKKILRKLESELSKQGITSRAVKAASDSKNISTAFVRMVLKGEYKDLHEIIPFLDNYLKEHLKKIEEVTNKIGKYDN